MVDVLWSDIALGKFVHCGRSPPLNTELLQAVMLGFSSWVGLDRFNLP